MFLCTAGFLSQQSSDASHTYDYCYPPSPSCVLKCTLDEGFRNLFLINSHYQRIKTEKLVGFFGLCVQIDLNSDIPVSAFTL